MLAAMILVVFPLSAVGDCVVLLHGLARTANAMQKLESRLLTHGYQVANVNYPSRESAIEELAPWAVSRGLNTCKTFESTRIHFVTHSMGGILVRYYLQTNRIETLGHVVMIAPPNQGSEVVDAMAEVPGFAWVNGPAGLQLGTDKNSVPSKLGPVDYSVGIIAGNKTFNPLLSQLLPNPDDGKVSVASTKVDGMADFAVVNASHPFIMNDETVIGHVLEFLKTGSFRDKSP